MTTKQTKQNKLILGPGCPTNDQGELILPPNTVAFEDFDAGVVWCFKEDEVKKEGINPFTNKRFSATKGRWRGWSWLELGLSQEIQMEALYYLPTPQDVVSMCLSSPEFRYVCQDKVWWKNYFGYHKFSYRELDVYFQEAQKIGNEVLIEGLKHAMLKKFSDGIKNVLKQIHPQLTISNDAVVEITKYLIFARDFLVSHSLLFYPDEPFEHPSHVIKVIFGDEIAGFAIHKGEHAVTMFDADITNTIFDVVSIPHNADRLPSKDGIYYEFYHEDYEDDPIRAIEANEEAKMKWYDDDPEEEEDDKILGMVWHKYQPVSVYLNAVVEYLAAELLEISGNKAKSEGENEIDEEYVGMAIFGDPELFGITLVGIVSNIITSADNDTIELYLGIIVNNDLGDDYLYNYGLKKLIENGKDENLQQIFTDVLKN